MNSADKRIEELMNRAGQTISDLPKAYSYDQMIKAEETVTAYLAKLYPDDPIRNEPENYLWFILHLTDIIDRLEWALENVCGERDYLAYRMRRHMDCQSCGWIGTCDKTPDHCKGWVFDGVPEGLSADDD